MIATEGGQPPDRYAVMGYPLHHSRSPFIHARFAQQCAQRLVYEALEVRPEDFTTAVSSFFAAGGRGLNITLPHKLAAYEWAHSLSERARRAGAVNTLAVQGDGTVLGDNTDGAGLVRDLTVNLRHDLRGQRVLILGAGGAARGVIGPLLECGPSELAVTNRTESRALNLVSDFIAADPGLATVLRAYSVAALAGAFDVIINATSASLAGELPEIGPPQVHTTTLCYDMAYGSEPTVFVRWARAHHLRAEMGLGMLVEQAAESFFLWRGVRPQTRAVLAELQQLTQSAGR
ncbi:MAG: shikimate dehydrogenase [Steroidobacteraceae bacterium]